MKFIWIHWMFQIVSHSFTSTPFNLSQFNSPSIHLRLPELTIIMDWSNCTCSLYPSLKQLIEKSKRKMWMFIQILWLQKHEVQVNLLSEIPRQFSGWFPWEMAARRSQTPSGPLAFPLKFSHWSPIYLSPQTSWNTVIETQLAPACSSIRNGKY